MHSDTRTEDSFFVVVVVFYPGTTIQGKTCLPDSVSSLETLIQGALGAPVKP